MPPIDQDRPLAQRWNDFGPEFGAFLQQIWHRRSEIRLDDFDAGTSTLYKMYSGGDGERPFDSQELLRYRRRLREIRRLTPRREIKVRGPYGDVDLSTADSLDLAAIRRELWEPFYRFPFSHGSEETALRIYVNFPRWEDGAEIMKLFCEESRARPGFNSAKIAGPGALRNDRIVAYFSQPGDREAVLQKLLEAAARQPFLFVDPVPALVRRVQRGIGIADQVPRLETVPGKRRTGSYGKFYVCIIWLALKNVPAGSSGDDAARHMLDNLLHSMRLLRVDPARPQEIPARAELQKYYREVIARFDRNAHEA